MAFTYEIDLKGNIASEAQKSANAVKVLEGALKNVTNQLTKASALGNVQAHSKLTQQSQMLTVALDQEKNKLAQITPAASSAGSALDAIPWARIAQGVLAVTAAIGAATVALLGFALKAADSKRNLLLQLEALTGSAAGARELSDAMDEVSASGLMADDAVEKIGRSLAAAGYKGKALSNALQNVATVSATAGEEAGAKIQALYDKIAAGGGKVKLAVKALAGTGLEGVLKPGIVTADQLGKAIKTRFGDVAEKQMLGFSAQMQGVKHNLSELFSDIDITPFLQGLKSVTSLLDQNTSTGKMLKTVITDAFGAIGKVAAKVFPVIRTVLLQVGIEALKIAIAVKPLGKELGKLWAELDKGGAGVGIVKLLTIGIKAMGIAAMNAVTTITMLVRIVNAFVSVGSAGATAAKGLIDGLVTGITGGVGRVIGAVKNLGSQVISSLKSVLQSHSPSKLAFNIGHGGVGEGLAQGVERAVPRVMGASRSLGAASAAGTAAGASGDRRGGGMHVEIKSIVIDGAGKSAQEITDLMVATTFERIGLARGLG